MHPIDTVFEHVKRNYPHGIFAYDLSNLLTAAYTKVYGTEYPCHYLLGIVTRKLNRAGISVHCSTD